MLHKKKRRGRRETPSSIVCCVTPGAKVLYCCPGSELLRDSNRFLRDHERLPRVPAGEREQRLKAELTLSARFGKIHHIICPGTSHHRPLASEDLLHLLLKTPSADASAPETEDTQPLLLLARYDTTIATTTESRAQPCLPVPCNIDGTPAPTTLLTSREKKSSQQRPNSSNITLRSEEYHHSRTD